MLTSTALRATRFHVTRFREGYDIAEVDELLERLATTLESLEAGRPDPIPVTTDDLLDARFTTTRMTAGYDVVEVDDLLDMGLEALRQHADVASAAASVEEAAWAAATAAASASAGAMLLHDGPGSDGAARLTDDAAFAAPAAGGWALGSTPSAPSYDHDHDHDHDTAVSTAMPCSVVARELSLAQATSYGEHRDVLVVEGPDGTRWTATSVTRTDTGIVLTVG